MAYGKDKATLQQTGSFGQRAKQHQNNKQTHRSSGGGGLPYFVNQYKPSLDDPDTIRILEGQYQVPQLAGQGDTVTTEMVTLEFFPFAEHYDGREKKSTICSAGPFSGSKTKAAPCHGCDLFWSGMEAGPDGKKRAGRVSRREMQVFSIIDYATYHELEQVDFKTGQVRINDQSGKPWTHWVRCTGRGCDACKAGKPTKQGERRSWPLGIGHYNTLLDANKEIGKSCVGCKSVDTIISESWRCSGCGEMHIDMTTTTLKKQEIEDLVNDNMLCVCGYNGLPTEVFACTHCTNQGGTAKRAQIFDVDINVKRVPASDGGNQTTLSISRWSAPKDIDPAFKELAEPLDLAKTYAPTPLDKQAELFKVPAGGVRKPVTASDAARPYNAPANQYKP